MSDITYEELTLSAIISLKYYITNLSDITYEELTLSSSFLIVDSLIFSRTLPMRNWHSHVLSFIKFLILSDITYEELTRLSGIVKVSPFSMKCGRTLPMRNWHSPKIVIIECFILCRTLPMRNWHYPHHPQQSLHQGFVGHYLWGIDTKS